MICLPRNTCHWSPGGTKTFRNKSGMLIGDIGSNLQNPSDDICRIYIPDDGKEFIQVDCAGAEALIVAWECEDGRFRSLFTNGIKPHTFVAMNLFQPEWKKEQPFDVQHLCSLSIPDLAKHPEWKALSKIIKNTHERYFIGKKTCHCFSADHEVLTKDGWKLVSEKPEEIAVWNKESKISFEKVSWNEFEYDGKFIEIEGKTISQRVTENHRLITMWGDKWKELTAEETLSYRHTSFRFPCNGLYSGNLKLEEAQIQLLCAIQADGTYTQNRTRFHFRKERKMYRLKEILRKLSISFESGYYDADDSFRIYFDTPEFVKEWLPEKKFTKQFLNLCGENLDTILKEIFYWDGHVQYNGSNAHWYFSKELSNVELIKTIAHLRGKQAIYNFEAEVYRLSLNNRKFSVLQNKIKAELSLWPEKVYCPTTSTGYFLVRRNGKISVTGNSFNYCKTAASFRFDVLKEAEGKIMLSLHQAELFESIYHYLFPEIKKWQKTTEETIKATRTLRNLFGHPMHFGSHITDKIIREGVAWVPQSTVGEIGANAFRDMQRYIEDENKSEWDVLNLKHDSILCQAPAGKEALECAKIMSDCLSPHLVSNRGEHFQMKTEISIGKNWGKYDEETNPDGMKEIVL